MKAPLSLPLMFIFSVSPLIGLGQTLTPAEAAAKIEAAMPAPLPQSPQVKRLGSDARDDMLKGKVKSVSISSMRTPSIKKSEGFYDENGDLTKEIWSDHYGNPRQITIFGNIDGKRVARVAYISYPYDPPPPPPPAPGVLPKLVRDDRYDFAYDFKYDEQKRLVEQVSFWNTGKVLRRKLIAYEGNRATCTSVDHNGQSTIEWIEVYDKDGHVTEVTTPARNGYGETKYYYKYLSYDSKGNWLKRLATGKVGMWNGGQRDYSETEIREITYH